MKKNQFNLQTFYNQSLNTMKRTPEKNKEIINRIKLIIEQRNLSQKQLEEITEIQQATLSKYLNDKIPVGDSFLYALTCNFFINPRWLENGEEPMYLSSVEQENTNTGAGTQINNINGDNNVSMTLPIEAWDMLHSQQRTIERQQESVSMAQQNMMELIKAMK